MLEIGARPIDLEVVDLQGNPRRLHAFRRKSHVVVLFDPAATEADLAARRERRAAESQRWTWLQAETVVPAGPPPNLAPGIYIVSRWGRVIAVHPPGPWVLERIEKDLLTFEAQDSCGTGPV
jgi:hypothetical protein